MTEHDDFDLEETGSNGGEPSLATAVSMSGGGKMLAQIVGGDKPSKCPRNHVAMVASGTRQISTTSGNTYVFQKNQVVYVQLIDRDAVAAQGASEVNEEELAAEKAALLAEARAEAAKQAEAELAAEKAAADKAAVDKAAADKAAAAKAK